MSWADRHAMSYGRRALLAVLQVTDRAAVAAVCGVSPRAVSHWSSGSALPSARARRRLGMVYGITPSAWDRLWARDHVGRDLRR